MSFLSAFCAFFVLFSCSNESDSNITAAKNVEKTELTEVRYEQELSTIRKDIKDASNLYLVLRDIEAPFLENVTYDPQSYLRIIGRKKQALALGAAGADLNYIAMFGQGAKIPGYVNVILDLAAELGISDSFDEDLVRKMTDTGDTTITYREKSELLSKAYRKAEKDLFTDDRAEITTLIVAAGWLESMHIAASVSAQIEPQREVDAEVWNLIFGAEKVIRMLEFFPNDTDCASIAADIRSLEPLLKRMNNSHAQDVHSLYKELTDATSVLRNKWFV